MTADAYLAFERSADARHQWIDGQIFPLDDEPPAMAGESLAHGTLTANLIIALAGC